MEDDKTYEFNTIKNHILGLLVSIEILLFVPRLVFYVVNDIIPLRILGLPFITLTFVMSVSIWVIIILLNGNKVGKGELILLFILLTIFFIDAMRNPVRDVFAEMQGLILFVIDYSIFRHLKISPRKLIAKIIFVLSISILTLGTLLLVKRDALPTGAANGIRFEGFFTSSGLLVLLPFSVLLFIRPYRHIFIGVLGLISSIFLMILTSTRTTIIGSLFAAFILLFYLSRKRIKIFLVSGLGMILLVSCIIFIYQNSRSSSIKNFQMVVERFTQMERHGVDNYRLRERKHELELFKKSPIWGIGYGLSNDSNLKIDNRNFFGHNFYTSLLCRKGLLSVFILLIIFVVIRRNLLENYNPQFFSHYSIFHASFGMLAGTIVVLFFANFSYYLIFGTIGAMIGITEASFTFNKDI